MERCSACRARLGDAEICPRCGCDFTLAIAAEKQARQRFCQAMLAWQQGNGELAQQYLQRSLSLKQSKLTHSVAAMLLEEQG